MTSFVCYDFINDNFGFVLAKIIHAGMTFPPVQNKGPL